MKQRQIVPALVAAAVPALLAACQAAPPERAEEPLPAQIAARLATVRQERTAFPDFADVPAPPTGVRTADQWREFVTGAEAEGAGLQGWVQQNPAWNTDTPGHVSGARAALAGAGPPPPPDQQAQSEAYAARMRALTVPPPPPPQ